MNNVVFHENRLSETGTSVALFDYAYYSREFLNINPIIVFPENSNSNNECVEKYKKEFQIYHYKDKNEIQNFIDQNNVDYFYAIKFGINDNLYFKNCKNLIHVVFSCCDFHGDVYAFVSEWLSIKNTGIPFVPHMINLPNHDINLRQELGIPKDAIVMGRYGGKDTFDIDFVKQTIENTSNFYFLFANTPKFTNNKNCLFLDPILELNKKVEFINTCDAMIHARSYGETFGLAVLEFACNNKQIITYDNEELQNSHPLGGRNHFLYLKDDCHKFKNKEDLLNIFDNFQKNNPFDTTRLNEQFSPYNVMMKFKEVFYD
jgi:hypothetical protein